MIVLSYDIKDDKLRTRFAKYIKRFGHRLQYSVYEIDNSERMLENIIIDIRNKYEPKFSQEDTVMIFKLSATCKIIKMGYAKNEDKDVVII